MMSGRAFWDFLNARYNSIIHDAGLKHVKDFKRYTKINAVRLKISGSISPILFQNICSNGSMLRNFHRTDVATEC